MKWIFVKTKEPTVYGVKSKSERLISVLVDLTYDYFIEKLEGIEFEEETTPRGSKLLTAHFSLPGDELGKMVTSKVSPTDFPEVLTDYKNKVNEEVFPTVGFLISVTIYSIHPDEHRWSVSGVKLERGKISGKVMVHRERPQIILIDFELVVYYYRLPHEKTPLPPNIDTLVKEHLVKVFKGEELPHWVSSLRQVFDEEFDHWLHNVYRYVKEEFYPPREEGKLPLWEIETKLSRFLRDAAQLKRKGEKVIDTIELFERILQYRQEGKINTELEDILASEWAIWLFVTEHVKDIEEGQRLARQWLDEYLRYIVGEGHNEG